MALPTKVKCWEGQCTFLLLQIVLQNLNSSLTSLITSFDAFTTNVGVGLIIKSLKQTFCEGLAWAIE
jgi:hypothetical protein